MAMPDWDLFHCLPLNDLLCHGTDKCGNFWSEVDFKHTQVLFYSNKHLWWALYGKQVAILHQAEMYE